MTVNVSGDLRITVILCAHVLMTAAGLWLIATADLSLTVRAIAGVLSAAILLPWLQSLAARRLERLTGLALLLVLIVGIGIVEVLASGAQWGASVLLGAAMLEFAVLISLARARPARGQSGSAQR